MSTTADRDRSILLLGGTAEARELAGVLVPAGFRVLTSLAGAVRAPALPLGEVRVGGFGGVDGLSRFLREHPVGWVVDATHPFAARISANAAAAAATTGTPLVRLQRPGWSGHPRAATWRWVADPAEAVAVGRFHRRPFLTTGRQSLADFLPWADRAVLARVVDPPALVIPDRWRVVRSRGPYDLAAEEHTLRAHGADLLVTKDSGGTHTVGKLDAAARLGVAVIVIRRPPTPTGVTVLASIAEVLTTITGRPPAAR